MMPKPTESEKKICPKAATHTLVSPSADQSGVNSASRPLPAPGRKSAATTREMKATNSTGMKITEVAPMPFCTPSAITASTKTQTSTRGTVTPETKSRPTPGSPALRNLPNRKPSGSSPHALSMEKKV